MGWGLLIPVAPDPGSTIPPPVNSTGSAGVSTQYARADHTHVSSIQKVVLPTDGNGQVTWTYPTAFAAAPVVQVTVETNSGQPYIGLITSNTATPLSVQVLRAQTLPSLSGVSLLTGLIAALANFNVFAGSVGAGVNVHIFAAKATT